MKRKDGMHRLSLGRQEEDLVSGIRQCPGSRSEHPPQASGTLLSRVQRVLQSPVGCLGSVAWLWGQEEHRRQV